MNIDIVEKLLIKLVDFVQTLEGFEKKKSILLYNTKLSNLKSYSTIKKANAMTMFTNPFTKLYENNKQSLYKASFTFLSDPKNKIKLNAGEVDAYIPITDIYNTLKLNTDEAGILYIEFVLIEILTNIVKDDELVKVLDKYDLEDMEKQKNKNVVVKRNETDAEVITETFSRIKMLYQGEDANKNRDASEIVSDMQKNKNLMEYVQKFSETTARNPSSVVKLLGQMSKQ